MRKHSQKSDEAVVAMKRVMTAEQRASTCKRRRCKLDGEKKVMVERPTKGDNPPCGGASETARSCRGASVGINAKLS